MTEKDKFDAFYADVYSEEDEKWEGEQNECYYGAEFCFDPIKRDIENCLGCFVTMPPSDTQEKPEGEKP